MGKLLEKMTGMLSGNIGDTVKEVASIWKVPADVVLANSTKVAEIQAGLTQKTLESANVEIQAAADIIKAEAQSQSWLPRNVRPLLLLLWGVAITLSSLGIRAALYKWFELGPCPPLDPWMYKLTFLGYTGYVMGRTYEKSQDKDN